MKTILKYNQLPENQSKGKFLKEAKDKWHITLKKLRILINADLAFKTMEARGQYWGWAGGEAVNLEFYTH